MNKQTVLTSLLVLCLLSPLSAQRQAGSPAPPPPPPTVTPSQQPTPPTPPALDDEGEVVRITANLVQVDALVTKDGQPVIGLQPEDFEVLQDGRPQQITAFSYVAAEPDAAQRLAGAASEAPGVKAKQDKYAPPVPIKSLRPEQVRRTMAFVVGGMPLYSTFAVRDALTKFVDEQMQPGDFVGIFRFGSGVFTADRQQLRRAATQIRWRPNDGAGLDVFETERADYTLKAKPRPEGALTFESAEARAVREHNDAARACSEYTKSIDRLRFVVRGMRELPGRKSIVFFSAGLPIGQSDPTANVCVQNGLRDLVEDAARASVVINAIDARGLVNTDIISAADEVLPENTDRVRANRTQGFWESGNGLNYMAENTGGRFLYNMNDLSVPLRRLLNEQRGYYLLGYRPSEETFKGRKFHRISVRVRRSGVRVRTRNGFYGTTDEESRPQPPTGDRQLYTALASPLNAGYIRTQLTSFFGDDPRVGSFVRALLYINGQDIAFTDEPDGQKKAVLDVAAVTFDGNGHVAYDFNRTHTLRLSEDGYKRILLHGLTYAADVPVKKAGAYQFRIVVRDAAAGHLGSAGQYVEVPDLEKGEFALSGLVLNGAAPGDAVGLKPGVAAEAAFAPASPATLAVRRFRPGAALAFSYLIYNPRLERATGRPRLSTQVRLFREGRQVFATNDTPLEAVQQGSFSRLTDDGLLRLRPDAKPGDYVLQVIVSDMLPGAKPRTATQWIDFEVVK